jgi:predicted protein tyrosine phosphatase
MRRWSKIRICARNDIRRSITRIRENIWVTRLNTERLIPTSDGSPLSRVQMQFANIILIRYVKVKQSLKAKFVPLHAMKALAWRGGIASTHCRPRHYMGVSRQRHAPAAL